MLLVRQVALPKVPYFALWSCFPMCRVAGCVSRCCWFGTLLVPKVPCFALWSCFPMEPCGFPAGSYSPMVPCFALWSCFPMVLCAFPGGSCFSMMPERLPRSGNLFRTDFRFAPSLPQRFACGLLPFTRDMGVHGLCGRVPDSAGNVSPWIASAQT